MSMRRTITHPDGREATTVEQLEATRDAWQAARQAIDDAWRITPDYLTGERMTIHRGSKNQTLAYQAAQAMASNAQSALDMVRRMALARGKGTSWAAESDEAAARDWKAR